MYMDISIKNKIKTYLKKKYSSARVITNLVVGIWFILKIRR